MNFLHLLCSCKILKKYNQEICNKRFIYKKYVDKI